jgi:hypothetical protein
VIIGISLEDLYAFDLRLPARRPLHVRGDSEDLLDRSIDVRGRLPSIVPMR